MQAVILAAGKGERMGALTEGEPKALLQVLGKTLLEHKLDMLPNDIDEVVLVVGYLGSKIHDYLGGIYKDKRVLYVEQDEFDGTAGALWYARDILHDDFLVMNGDDIYAGEDIARISTARGWALCALKVPDLGSGAKIVTNKDGVVTDIKEREEHSGGAGYLNTGLYALDMRIFAHERVPKSKGSAEFGLPQTMLKAGIPIELVPATFWLQITSPKDIEKAEEIMKSR